jgi:predicted DNA binding CopG/RHH family protein
MKYAKNNPPKEPAVQEQSLRYLAKAKMKRLTIDVPTDLHTTIKVECARKGVNMADAIRDILEKEFGKSE